MKKYICVEGNIGAGKTTLATQLQKQLSAHLLLENFETNPHLQNFYKNPQDYALQTELHFLYERFKQIQTAQAQHNLIVSDYFFRKSLWFASINLTKKDYTSFKNQFIQLQSKIPLPTHLIYIDQHPIESKTSILNRGRNMELEISLKYLQKLNNLYLSQMESLPTQIKLLKVSGTALRENQNSQMVKIIEFLM